MRANNSQTYTHSVSVYSWRFGFDLCCVLNLHMTENVNAARKTLQHIQRDATKGRDWSFVLKQSLPQPTWQSFSTVTAT